MKKLVLFAAICATVALTACNKKQAAPATDAVTEEKTEVVADSTLTTPADSTAVDSTAVQ